MRLLTAVAVALCYLPGCDNPAQSPSSTPDISATQILGDWYVSRIGETILDGGKLVDDYEDVPVDSAGYASEADIIRNETDSVFWWSTSACAFSRPRKFSISGDEITFGSSTRRMITMVSADQYRIAAVDSSGESEWWIFSRWPRGREFPCDNNGF